MKTSYIAAEVTILAVVALAGLSLASVQKAALLSPATG